MDWMQCQCFESSCCRNAILWCNKVNALHSVVRVIDHYCTGMSLLTLGGHVQRGLQLGLGRLCSNFGLFFYAAIFCLFFFSFHPFFFRMCPFFSKRVFMTVQKSVYKNFHDTVSTSASAISVTWHGTRL